jgi:hypothetical protein
MKQFLATYTAFVAKLVTCLSTVMFSTLLGITPEQLQRMLSNIPKLPAHELYAQNLSNQGISQNISESVKNRKSVKLAAFLQLLQDYRPHAPWITEELLELSFVDFEQAFAEVVTLLTKAEKRWFYFCDKLQDYDQDKYWQQCLWQCMYYTQWLERLYVVPNGELLYKETDSTPVPVLACPLAEYKALAVIDTLYAFYADCLAHFFCFSVDYASRERDNIQVYISCWLTGKLCLEKLEKVVERLKDTPFYGAYHLTIKRYQEVYALLDEEFLLAF